MQKDRTTLALAILVVLLGAIAPESFWIRVLASAFAVFLIFWGRDSERTEAWVSRLPVGGQLLTKWLHQLDLIVSPRDQDYEEHVRRVISGYDAKQRKFLRRTGSRGSVGLFLNKSTAVLRAARIRAHTTEG